VKRPGSIPAAIRRRKAYALRTLLRWQGPGALCANAANGTIPHANTFSEKANPAKYPARHHAIEHNNRVSAPSQTKTDGRSHGILAVLFADQRHSAPALLEILEA